jgi:hypothetical protein
VTDDVLNLGVAPSILIDRVAQRFRELGGIIRENARLEGVAVSAAAGSALDLGPDEEPITTRLVIDCMGNASPITRQQRHGMTPGMLLGCNFCLQSFVRNANVSPHLFFDPKMESVLLLGLVLADLTRRPTRSEISSTPIP